MAADDWRVSQTWAQRLWQVSLRIGQFTQRVADYLATPRGGFTAGQQMAVYQQVAGPLRGVLDPSRRGKGATGTLQPNELVEMLRLVARWNYCRRTKRSSSVIGC